MKKQKSFVTPISKILSLMPKGDIFLDTRKVAGGAYISVTHLKNIERILEVHAGLSKTAMENEHTISYLNASLKNERAKKIKLQLLAQ